MQNFINKIGIEIEGAWTSDRLKINYDDLYCINDKPIQHDGSVSGFRGPLKVGEICLGPYSIADLKYLPKNTLKKTLTKVRNDILECYPDRTNNTCGIHFHVSFANNIYYLALMQSAFNDFYRQRVREFAVKRKLTKINHKRIAAQHLIKHMGVWKQYCGDVFVPENQYMAVEQYDKARYQQLNFCFARHSTLECRVFSSRMRPLVAYNCLVWFVNLVNEFLSDIKTFENIGHSVSFTLKDQKIEQRKKNNLIYKLDNEDELQDNEEVKALKTLPQIEFAHGAENKKFGNLLEKSIPNFGWVWNEPLEGAEEKQGSEMIF